MAHSMRAFGIIAHSDSDLKLPNGKTIFANIQSQMWPGECRKIKSTKTKQKTHTHSTT